MASPNVYPTGAGGSSGSTLATAYPLLCSGSIWYVSSSAGTDAASPRGKERIRPLATLAQAITNAAANDIIVCMSGHTETLTAVQTIATAGLTILGEGTGNDRPRFTRNVNDFLWDITGAGVTIDNIYFVASSTATTSAKVRTAGATTIINNCYFQQGANDTGPALQFITGAGTARITSTTFISSATAVSAQPESAVKVTNALTTMDMDTVVFDGNTTGWSNVYAFSGDAAITRLRAVNIDLLNDSDMILATGTVGHVTIRNKTGSARVVWTA